MFKKMIILFALALFVPDIAAYSQNAEKEKFEIVQRQARISPDYCGIVIAPDIAPLNFVIKENGLEYRVKIYSDKGKAIEISNSTGKIIIPPKQWKTLLESNRGNTLNYEILKKEEGGWVKFQNITNKIANENIDGFIVYRKMQATHSLQREHIGIFQRNTSSFEERSILNNHLWRTQSGCMNCHSFCKNEPDKVLMGVRVKEESSGTVFAHGQKVDKLDLKIGFTSWHPSGKIAAYSIDNLPMFLRTGTEEIRDTVDLDSAILYYDIEKNAVRTTPELSKKDVLETWPEWSADGKYLYFCSTPMPWTDKTKVPPEEYQKVKYDLVRISYDINSDTWGQQEPVLSSKDTGKSIAMPKISPDGRWLLFCMCDYGFFPPWLNSSGFYIMDLNESEKTGHFKYNHIDTIDGKYAGKHSWSSNSRWIAFSSKKDYGRFTRIYLSYVDENGNVSKSFVLPQEDPQYYDSSMEIFNNPEFTVGPIKFSRKKFEQAAIRKPDSIVATPITMATPKINMPAQYQGLQ